MLEQAEGGAQGQGRGRARHHAAGRFTGLPGGQDGGMSTQLARMLKQAGQKAPEVKPVLEVNAEHPLVQEAGGLGALRRPGAHPVRPGAAGRRRLAGRPGGLREARQRAAGLIIRRISRRWCSAWICSRQ